MTFFMILSPFIVIVPPARRFPEGGGNGPLDGTHIIPPILYKTRAEMSTFCQNPDAGGGMAVPPAWPLYRYFDAHPARRVPVFCPA